MIFHVLSIPMYPTRKEITLCAFTQKVYKFCQSMTERGHTVFHYGHPDSEVRCTEHFDVISKDTHIEIYKNQHWKDFLPQGIDNKAHNEFNEKAAKLIKKNKQSENDFVLAFWGVGHLDCCETLKDDFSIVEPSIGYESAFAPFRVFESYAHLHKQHYKANSNSSYGIFTDHVIRPGFYFEDFQYKEKKEDYLLFLGRMVDCKGIQIAQDLSRTSGMPIKFVGPQSLNNKLKQDNDLAEYFHTVSHEERRGLLANAKALIMPSLYLEPCGWSMLEAFISGTPVISTDWGGLSEYNIHGKTGFRCKSFNEFFHALQAIGTIEPSTCREYAEENFSIQLVSKMYENYFSYLIELKTHPLGSVLPHCNFLVK